MRKHIVTVLFASVIAAVGVFIGATTFPVTHTNTVTQTITVNVTGDGGTTATMAGQLTAAGYTWTSSSTNWSRDQHRDIRDETWVSVDANKPWLHLSDGAIETVNSANNDFWCATPQEFAGSVGDALVAYAQGQIASAGAKFVADDPSAKYIDVDVHIGGSTATMRCYKN